MGATKTEHYTEEQISTSTILKALGHPARVAILEFLMRSESCICGDIVNELPLSQPTVSQHLKELKSAGLIKGTVEGTSICYCIDETAVEKISGYFQYIKQQLKNKQGSCCS